MDKDKCTCANGKHICTPCLKKWADLVRKPAVFMSPDAPTQFLEPQRVKFPITRLTQEMPAVEFGGWLLDEISRNALVSMPDNIWEYNGIIVGVSELYGKYNDEKIMVLKGYFDSLPENDIKK